MLFEPIPCLAKEKCSVWSAATTTTTNRRKKKKNDRNGKRETIKLIRSNSFCALIPQAFLLHLLI